MSQKHTKLNQSFATAICGNDILSATLYVSGIAIIFAGVYAPIVLAVIALVLLLYKSVYTEVVEALPINGGAYNCLLNGTSKRVASISGVMTILSYIATVVISAKVAIEYAHSVLPIIPVLPTTIALMLLFAILVISGLKDSAKVALGIFSFHILTLVGFLVLGSIFFFKQPSLFSFNFAQTAPIIHLQGGLIPALALGFSASLLGVSGFESSANFVEEQKRGVFRKTLRNMLIGVAIFNPLVALVVLNSLPFPAIQAASEFLLADAARAVGGQVFQYIVVADAVLVLSGAVLTGFVGVSGLIHRMSVDGVLPVFLSKESKQGSSPRTVVTFFILCTSILLLTHGNLLSLAGVYTISFLGVMTSFAVGNLVLKQTRPELKRTYKAPFIVVLIAAAATFFGILGNVKIDPNNFVFFGYYFLPALLLVFGVMFKDKVIKFVVSVTRPIPPLHGFFKARFEHMLEGTLVVFIYNPHRLFTVLDYINKNETGQHIILVNCKDEGQNVTKSLHQISTAIPILQKSGVFPNFKISLIHKHQVFGPAVVNEVAKELKVPKNQIFIGSIHEHHPFDYDDFGGVRIIL